MRYRIGLVALAVSLAALSLVGAWTPASAVTCSTRAARIEVFGDSISVGQIGNDPLANEWSGWRAGLRTDLGTDGYSVSFVGTQKNPTTSAPDRHDARAGTTAAYLSGTAANWTATSNPDIALVEIGTVDILIGQPAYNRTAVGDNTKASLAGIFASAPRSQTLISKLPPINVGGSYNTYRGEINTDIPGYVTTRQAAGQRIRAVSVGDQVLTSELSDGVHPNSTGYSRMQSLWKTEVESALANAFPPVPMLPNALVSSGTPAFQWCPPDVTGASVASYSVADYDAYGNNYVNQTGLLPANVCSGGVCSYTPGSPPNQGMHIWAVNAKAANNDAVWSAFIAWCYQNCTSGTAKFKPTAPRLDTPTATSSRYATYTWQEVANVNSGDYYELYDQSTYGYDTSQPLLAPSTVCSSGVCTFHSAYEMIPGQHVVWVRGHNPQGTSDFSEGRGYVVGGY